MSEETIGVIIAAIALIGLLWYARKREMARNVTTQGSTRPIAGSLAAAVDPAQFDVGPSYFIANQPYYFAPPVSNIMPPAVASRTVATNEDGGCGYCA